MSPRNRSRSKTGRLWLVGLMCFGLSALLLMWHGPERARTEGGTPPAADELIPVTSGSSIRKESAPGAKHSFAISLNQGQLLRVVIDKGDLALSVALSGPAGLKLTQVSHAFEPVEISFPVEVTGAYTIEVQSLERAEPQRPYVLSVPPVAAITAPGRKDSEARQAMAGAQTLRADWTAASLRQAIEKYDKAALTWTAAGDLANAGRAILASGDVFFILSEYRESLDRYQRAAKLGLRAGDKIGEAEALSQIGLVYSYLGDNDSAKKHLTRAMVLLEAENKEASLVRHIYGEALSNLAEMNYGKGDLVKSSAECERARKVFHEINDRGGEARVHLFGGNIAGSLGQPEKAIAEISQALDLYRAVSNKAGEGLALIGLGLSHSSKRDEDRAIKLYREAIQTFRAIGDHNSEAIAMNALGQAYENLSEYSIALDNYEKALRLFQNTGALNMASVAMFKVAKTYRLMGKLDQALANYRECLKLSRAAGKVRTEANALNEVAIIYASQGQREQTLQQYQRIQKFYETIGDRRGQVMALNGSGDFLLRLGEKQQALAAYQQALPLSEKAGDNGLAITTLYNLARAHRDIGSLDVALAYIKQSLKVIEDLRTNVGSPDFRASYFSGVRKHYDLCIDILMQLDKARPGQGFATAALLASENSRARCLLDLLIESRANLRQGADPVLLNRERELQGLLRSQAQYGMDLSISGRDPAEIKEVASQMDQLRSEYQEIQAQLRDQHPQLSLARTAPLDLEQIQRVLHERDTVLLEYALGDERSYLWVVTSDSLQSYELPARKILEDAAGEFYKLVTSRQEFERAGDGAYQAKVEAADELCFEKGSKLSEMLLGPAAAQLGTRRLVFVTEGALQSVPFDALPVPVAQGNGLNTPSVENRPALITTNEIDALPSISTLVAIRAEDRRPISGNQIVAVLADPVFSRSDDRVLNGKLQAVSPAASDQPANEIAQRSVTFLRNGAPARLSHAAEEADAILAVTPRGTGMVAKGFDASRETAMGSRLGQYQIIHFATHSFRDSDHPELSGIVLTMVDSNGKETNGLMPLHDIYSLHLSAELTVLSACETALGKDIKGEGFVGLTHSFMSAGSKSVVSSLWKVDDRATAVLMADFYQSMLREGRAPAAALRLAKLKVRQEKRWSAPYFWAGFVFQGEYNNHIVVGRSSWVGFGIALSSVFILILTGLMLFLRRRSRALAARPILNKDAI